MQDLGHLLTTADHQRVAHFLQRWPSQRAMKRIRSRVRELTPRAACHRTLRENIALLNPVLRGWGNYFGTGNAADKFGQLDTYVCERLRRVLRQRQGRQLRAGVAAGWTQDYFHGLGLHRLRGTIHYPGAA
jgi:RNA-directed DNA polymerase